MIQTTLFPDTFKQNFPFSNDDIASIFEQVADLLAAQEDDFYRIRAYREGAQSIRSLAQPVVEQYQAEGKAGLEKLPHIGKRLASAIEELATTGELALLERLLIDVSPEDLFTTVPGIGQVLARRIHRKLGIDTLEALEQAAHDGTLATLPGFGRSRIQLVQNELQAMLDRSSRQRVKVRRWQQAQPPQTKTPIADPPVELLLEIDAQYRYLAGAGQLKMVTPRRFNPENKRWLPVMQLEKEGWTFNVLYSNTARSHELNKTHDWVVVYYEREGKQGQCTVVTETRGVEKGDRVVRGREAAKSA
jgi:hypothetical protein